MRSASQEQESAQRDFPEMRRVSVGIAVWHDDQQGTATVVLAALRNALHAVGKELRQARIAMIGMGAANVATYRILEAFGVDPGSIVAVRQPRDSSPRAR